MNKYIIMVEVPSTAPLLGVDGINTASKVKVIGVTKASNSSKACNRVSKKLDIPYQSLKALQYSVTKDGRWKCDKYILSQ